MCSKTVTNSPPQPYFPPLIRSARFSVSSILTPFFMGCVVGAIASGEVPAEGNGDPMSSWTGLLPLVIGAMFVAGGAYIAAVFLVRDSRAADEPENTAHFARSAEVGDDEAIAALRTYVAIRAKADAGHQADLQDARATLARLEKESHGR